MPSTENNIMDIVLAETHIQVLRQQQTFDELSVYINHLIVNHFDELISLLYRLDINEKRLKDLLQQHASEDAAPLIAHLIIERQEQKIKTREMFKPSVPISDDERW